MESLKRHGGWKSGNVAERYIDQSIQNTKTTAEMVTKNVHLSSTSRAKDFKNIETTELENDAKESLHEIYFELPKKKSKSSETTVTSVSDQNFDVKTPNPTNPCIKFNFNLRRKNSNRVKQR